MHGLLVSKNAFAPAGEAEERSSCSEWQGCQTERRGAQITERCMPVLFIGAAATLVRYFGTEADIFAVLKPPHC